MKNIFIATLKNEIGKDIILQGWMHNLRILGKIAFLFLRDGSGIVQLVIEDKSLIDKIKDCQIGSILEVSGKVKEAKTNLGVEIVASNIEILNKITEISNLDISKKDLNANLDTILDNRSISLRQEKHRAIFTLQSVILEVFREFLRKENFHEFVSPVLMGAPSESGADVFEVKYFNHKAYLAQSPQIYKQIMVGVFERVFTISKVFRAEKHNTSRHIMEITQMDAEMGFIDDYFDVMNVAEGFVKFLIDKLGQGNKYKAIFDLFEVDIPTISSKIPIIKVKEALKLIEKRTGKSAKREELDVDPDDEKEVSKWAKEKFNSDFVWLINFKKDKNFYTYNDRKYPDESLSYDLLFRGLEVLSGTHRIENYDLLIRRMKKQGLNLDNYEQYLLAFKYGMPKHGGFSFGLERLTQKFLGLSNIRYATLFPSDLKRLASSRIKMHIVTGKDKIFDKIIQILTERNIRYDLIEHSEAIGVKDSEILGQKPEGVVKSLILKGKKSSRNILLVLRGDHRIDFKLLKKKFKEDFTFEDPMVIKTKWGLDIGEIPPFGNILGLDTFFDKTILKEEKILFTIADKSKSVRINPKDLIEVLDANLI